ncbi:MAG TPA: TolC family protein [Bacteroidales bacterium]|nr:TolC family protein [Bacteroidales bacterium]
MKRLYITAVIFFITLAAQAQDTLVLEITKCRDMALESSLQMQIADAAINKAEGKKTQARSAWFPNISASATGLYSHQKINQELYLPTKVLDPQTGELVPNIATNPVTGDPLIGPDGNPLFNTYAYLPLNISLNGGILAGISAQQPLYAGGKIITGNKMAGIGTSMANTNKELQKGEVIFEAEKAYYTYLSVKQKVKLAKKYQALLERLVKTVSDSYDTGMVNRNDLLKVQVKYNEAILQVQKAENGLELSRMSLCRVIGVDLYMPVVVNDSIVITDFDPGSVGMQDASDRLEYKLLEQKTELAKENVKMVRGVYLPTAGVSVGYNYLNVNMQDANNYNFDGISAIASVKIPITKFGEGMGKIKAARADYKMSELKLEKIGKLLQLEIEQARLNLTEAYTRVNLTREALDQADENLRVSQNNYELGMETIVNVLEAQAEWQKAYANVIDAKTDFKIRQAKYLKVTNKIGQK